MSGKFFIIVPLALSLGACQSFHHRMEQKDPAKEQTPAAATATPAPSPAPDNEATKAADDKAAPVADAKTTASGDKAKPVEATEDVQIKMLDKNGKVVKATVPKSKDGKEMTKVAINDDEEKEAAKAVHESGEKASAAPVAATGAAADAKESDEGGMPSRHAGPVSGEKALTWLQHGNTRFVKGYLRKDGESAKDRLRLVASQKPHAAVLTCSDSRVPPELVFDQKLGEIYVVRVSDLMKSNSIAGLEYAVQYLGTNLVVLLGHDNCNAAEDSIMHGLLEKSKILSDAQASGEVKIARGFYHLDTGVVDWK